MPFGRYKQSPNFNYENLTIVSNLLQETEIVLGDFECFSEKIDNRSFVYFDPPYRPISATASFKSYSQYNFDDEEQRRLASYFKKLDKKGAKLMLSNSDPKNMDGNDNFFDYLYADFRVTRVAANRNINKDGTKRGPISELLITNY